MHADPIIQYNRKELSHWLDTFRDSVTLLDSKSLTVENDFNVYEWHLRSYASYIWTEYSLLEDPPRLHERTLRLIGHWTPYFQKVIEIRKPPVPPNPYDAGELIDQKFNEALCIFLASGETQVVEEVCKATNYGRALIPAHKRKKLNTQAGITARFIRAFFLKDVDWMRDEALELPLVTRSYDYTWWLPHQLESNLMLSLINENESVFTATFNEARKWYERSMRRAVKRNDPRLDFNRLQVITIAFNRMGYIRFGRLHDGGFFCPLSIFKV